MLAKIFILYSSSSSSFNLNSNHLFHNKDWEIISVLLLNCYLRKSYIAAKPDLINQFAYRSLPNISEY